MSGAASAASAEGQCRRKSWRLDDVARSLLVVRRPDVLPGDEPVLDLGGLPALLDRWLADAFAWHSLIDIYRAVCGDLPVHCSPANLKDEVKRRLEDAFVRRVLVLVPGPCFGPALPGSAVEPPPVTPVQPPPKPPRPAPKETLLLQLTRVDDHFAPKTERLDIVYELLGFSGKSVRLEITSPHYGGTLLDKDLTAPEKTDGTHTFHWDGKCQSGDLQDRYAHPLLSPFRVHLYHDSTYTDERPFKILYHSIVLKLGPWTPDEKEPPGSDAEAWVQYKLNQFGYYGGPVGSDTDDYLKKAVIRYKANHPKMHEAHYTSYTGDITDELKAALKKGDNDRKFPPPAAVADASKKSVVPVEELTYVRLTATTDEFGTTRPPHEQERLNRPLIPAEAEIYLKKKDNSKVLQPEAVGPVRISWRFKDADEDLSPQYTSRPAEPSQTQKYIEKALKQKNGRAGQGDNCPSDVAGLRTEPAQNWRTPFLTGAHYVPYDVQEDAGSKVVYSTACVDRDKYPKRLGKAGILLRPSYMAGDDYQFQAEIDFTGLPNKADLEKFHGIAGEANKIKAETGVFTVRRFHKVAVTVGWPDRKKGWEWGKIATEFEKSFFDLDTGKMAAKSIAQVLTEAQYKDIVTANTTHTDPSKIGYYADWLVGAKLPKQGNQNAADYKDTLTAFCGADFNDLIQEPLARQIAENVRKQYGDGFIIVNFLAHNPVYIQNDPANGDHKITPANSRWVAWVGSISLPDQVILLDEMDPDKSYYVIAHEMGHGYYLLHWENTGENNLNDHDQDDHNCMMSYSDPAFADPGHYAHQEPAKYTPHFCGKCNLALRGWDITAGGMVAKSAKKPKVAEKVNPQIQLAKDVVVVKKKHTSPARVLVTLKTDVAFDGKGTFTRSSDAVKFFTAASKGKEVTFNGKDNVFSGSKLTSGVKLYAEGGKASGAVNDVTLTLKLEGGSKTIGPDATGKMTAVELTLQICKMRTAPATDPVALSETDKIDPGRAIHLQNKDNKRLRAMLIVKKAKPEAYTGRLVLRAVKANLKLFQNETGAPELPLPHEMDNAAIPVAGQKLWAEGAKVSGKFKDTGFKLGIKDVENEGDRVVMTVVQTQLSICKSRTAVGKAPEAMTDADKINVGRYVHIQDPGDHHGRALLIVHQVKPKDFKGKLVLASLEAANPKVEVFKDETGGAALANPLEIDHTPKFPKKGEQRWAQGKTVSGALRDTGLKLGIKEVEDECDRVNMTVVRFKNLNADIPCTPANNTRLGNAPARHAMSLATGAISATEFTEDFGVNRPLVLVEGSLPPLNPVVLTVEVEPAGVGVPVRWSARRDTRAAPDGDSPDILKLTPAPNRRPTLTQDGGDALKATLLADSVGSFHICPFVDCNGSGEFDQNDDKGKRIDREPFLIFNVVMIRVKGFQNRSQHRQVNVSTNPTPYTSATGVGVSTGNFASGAGAGVHCDATVEVIGGGRDGKRGLDRLFGGWVNNEVAEDAVSNYQDPAPPNTVHPRQSRWVQPPAHAAFQRYTPAAMVPPPAGCLAAVPFTIQAAPVLDTSNFANCGTGGNMAVGTEGAPGPPTPIVKTARPRGLGERWKVEMWDSPGDSCPATHEGFPAARLVNYRFNLDFRVDLVFWTNTSGAAGATGDPASRLYASVQTNTWRIRFACTFNALGVAAVAQALIIRLTRDADPTRLAVPVEGTGLEARFPVSLNLLIVDATA